MKRYCKLGKHFADEERFTTITSSGKYKKADGTISHYTNTAKRHQCNQCLHKRYKEKHKHTSSIRMKPGSIIVGGILVY